VQIGLEIEPQAGALKTEGITFIPHGGEELSEALRAHPVAAAGGALSFRDVGRQARAMLALAEIRPSDTQASAPLTCSSLPRPGQPKLCACETCRETTPAEPRQPARIGPARAPIGALPRPANDAHTGRSRPQSQGGSPRSNGQAFDEARNPVTVAGRRCRASGRVRPCWDPAYPCCSPLTGWASGPVAASRPSRPAVAMSYLTEGGRVRPGSADWQ
jgi:hypothetical protein